MDASISRAEHEEFVKRMEADNRRQDKRIELLEEDVRQITELTSSVKELAVSMKLMATEQEKQGSRLETLEKRDGEMWRKVVGYVAAAIVSAVCGYIAARMGLV